MGIKNRFCSYIQLAFVVLTICNCIFGQQPDEVLKVSFAAADNPASPGGDAVLQCAVYGNIPKELVGISRYNNNGMNTVIFRNGDLLEDAPDGKYSMNILPDQSDGSTSYHVTISNIDYISDGGLYTCYALTVEGYVQAIATTRLDVTEDHLLPTCVTSSKNGMTFSSESKITLTCMAEDSSATTQWIRDDQIDVPKDQTTIRDGNTVITTLTHRVNKSDDGVSFTCNVLSGGRTVDGSRYCSIGPITVTNSTVVARQIAGLSVTVFAVVVTIAIILFIMCIVFLILFCRKCNLCQRSAISRASHLSSKKYSMRGRPGSFTDSTLSRGSIVPGGRESFTYNPSRPAPPPPAASIGSPSQPNGSAQPMSDYTKRVSSAGLSDAESLLMSTLLKKKKNKENRPESSASNNSSDEIIYANTDQLNILDPISEESNHLKGILNPGYEGDNRGAVFAVNVSTRKPSLSQANESCEIYENTADLAAQSSNDSRKPHTFEAQTEPPQEVYGNIDFIKPTPLAKPRPNPPVTMAKPINHSSGFSPTPAKPIPMPGITSYNSPSQPKPIPIPKQQNISPVTPKPEPLIKPRKEVLSTPMNPVPSSPTRQAPRPKPARTSSMDFEVPLPNPPVVPAPPAKPSYDIMSDTSLTPPKKATHGIMNDTRPLPPQKPTHDIMKDIRPPTPLKPTHSMSSSKPPPPPTKPVSSTHDIMSNGGPLPPPTKPNHVIMSNGRPPPPPTKPTHDIMSNSRPPTPPTKPAHNIMSDSRPPPPPKPVPRPRVDVNSRPPPPPKKPTYEI